MDNFERQVDAGAKWLRETQQAGKRLVPWEDLPNSTKKKWREYARGVVNAALSA